VIIGGVLYFTDAGPWLWNRVQELEGQCYQLLANAGTSMGGGVCRGAGKAVQVADSALTNIQASAANGWEHMKAQLNLGGAGDGIMNEFELPADLASLRSSAERLALKLRMGPESALTNSQSHGLLGSQLQQAVDNFTLGQRYLQAGPENAPHALPWLQHGAATPGYGVLSQLSLGDIYRQGAGDIPADPRMALQYYGQALQSIDVLQTSSSPEAKQMLHSLPTSPEYMKREIIAAVRQLKQTMPH
jgi:hypothetical protein